MLKVLSKDALHALKNQVRVGKLRKACIDPRLKPKKLNMLVKTR
jgi:hypothetical protein